MAAEKTVKISKQLFNELVQYHLYGDEGMEDNIKKGIEIEVRNNARKKLYNAALDEGYDPDQRQQIIDAYNNLTDSNKITVSLPSVFISQRVTKEKKFYSITLPKGTMIDGKDVSYYKCTAKIADIDDSCAQIYYLKDYDISLKKHDKINGKWITADEISVKPDILKYALDLQAKKYNEEKQPKFKMEKRCSDLHSYRTGEKSICKEK